MRSRRNLLAGIVALTASTAWLGCSRNETTTTTTTAASQSDDRERAVTVLNDATTGLAELRAATTIPYDRLESTRCAIVVPSLVKGAFIAGVQRGHGVATCRTREGWSGPIFVTLTGGSGGAQIGYQSSDVLLLVRSRHAMNKLFTSGFKLGAGVSAAAGPTGRGKTAGTDPRFDTEVNTYARSKGLFAGVDLSGLSIKHDDAAIAAIYGTVDVPAILDGRVPVPAEARPFLKEMRSVFPAVTSPRPGA